jgi:hypothetical protein
MLWFTLILVLYILLFSLLKIAYQADQAVTERLEQGVFDPAQKTLVLAPCLPDAPALLEPRARFSPDRSRTRSQTAFAKEPEGLQP